MLTPRSLGRWLNLGVVLDALPIPAWTVAAVFGGTYLVSRTLAVWAAVVASVLAAARIAFVFGHDRWTESQAAVRLDRLASAGALLLTMREISDPAWQERASAALSQARRPPLRAARPVLLTLGAVGFVLVVRIIPLPPPLISPVQAAAEHSVNAIAARSEALERELPVPSSMKEEIQKLRDEAETGKFSGSDWESADELTARLEEDARRRADALTRAADAAKRLEQAIASGASAEEQAREREALEKELAALETGGKPDTQSTHGDSSGEKTGKEGKEKEGSPDGKSKPGGKGGAPSSAQELREMRKALEKRRDELAKKFPGTGRPGKPESGTGSQSAQPAESSQQPGTQKGPLHDTPMRFGDETKFQADRLRYAPIPKSKTGNDPGELWGLSAASPKATPGARIAAPSGAVEGDETAPGVREGAAPPRYRGLVRQYFDARTP